MEIVWKYGNREKMEEDVKLSVLSVEGIIQLKEGK